MHVVLDTPAGGAADVELRLSAEDATVEDLLDAIGGGNGARGILIDGRFCHLDLALSEIGLYEGARVRPADGAPAGAEERAAATLELRVIAGLDSGRQIALPPAGVTVGRDEQCELPLLDDGVSRTHFTIAATPSGLRAIVSDLGSANGTWVEGRRISEPAEIEPGMVIEAGDVAFTVSAPAAPLPLDPVRQASLQGTIAFNRPPRVRSTGDAPAIEAPAQPGEGQKARFSVASAVGPLLMGGVMVLLLHSIIYALFMLLSPVLVLGNYLEQRRQNKRSSRGDAREFQEALTRFRVEVATRRAGERDQLRAAFPDLAEIVHRASAPDPRLWERRPDHDDFLHLSAGYGEVPFRPQVTDNWQSADAAELVLAEHGWLELAPIDVDLSGGGVVGIVGDRAPSLALARALVCQAAVLHGPADLTIAALAEESSGPDWDWVKWLPHARGTGTPARLAVGTAAAGALAAELTDGDPDDPRTTLAVLDIPALIEGRGAAGRALLRAGERVSGIVLARTTERLPAACTTVIELDEQAGEAVLSRPQLGQQVDPLLVAGLSERTARVVAVALARFEDADLQIPGGSLPGFVALSTLIGLPAPDGEQIADRWRATEHGTDLVARFAVAEEGPLDIDLVGDGPHGLIAGTTGAGKSELLRSLVASLAATHGPARVNFVLVDYKGGSAFAECAELPHTVGMVTDLDEHLGERALLSLEAELRYRERVLREHRTADIIEHDRLVAEGRVPALPRLVVIIDEFATLAAELPDFIASLVGIAQRGRSLGVHMILATQRPAGAVNENIRANTNLRICLRVQTPQDSTDVIDDPAAARIPRTQPGRAQIRLGPSELVPAQTALVSGTSADGPVSAVAILPFAPAQTARDSTGPARRTDGAGATGSPAAPSDLARLVTAADQAAAGAPPARRPWLEPLGDDLDLDWLLTLGPPRPIAGDPAPPAPVIGLGLADDPESQAQYPIGWNPSAGNLLLYGIGGSGTSTALQSIALGLARTTDPARVHVYVMDFGAGELAALAALPGVGAVTTAAEHERQSRLLRRLRGELAVRRSLDPDGRAAAPRIVLLLDGYAGFASEHADLAGDALREALARVWSDGPELGIHTAIAADRLGAVPTALASLSQQRIAFQLADIADYAQFGLSRRAIPRFAPGRAVIGGTGQVLQCARVRDPSSAIAELGTGGALSMAEGGPPPVAVLPESVPVAALLGGGRVSREPLFIPVGIGDETLEPVGFELYEGEHALVAGPPRTGRTTTLLVVAEAIARLYPGVELAGIAVRRGSRLRDCPRLARVATSVEEIPDLVRELRESERMQVLLIDDGDATEDPSRTLSDLFSGAATPHIHAVIAGRADELRSLGHWSAGARRSRVGLLVQPDLQTDGMLLGVTLPRRPPPPARPGCGYRVDAGGFELMQVAVVE